MSPSSPAPESGLLTYLESAASDEFVEFLHDPQGNRLRIRTGPVGHPCLVLNVGFTTPGRSAPTYQRLHQEWLARDYAPCTPTAPVQEGSAAEDLNCNQPRSHPLFAPFFGIDAAQNLAGQSRRIALFRDGLKWPHGHLDLERIAAFGLYAGIIVQGDVEVGGVFSQLTHTYPRCVLVGGSIHADSLGHGDSHMRVLGDVHVRNIVYGEYNDGSLAIRGAVHALAFISVDHDMHAEGGCQAPVCDWDDGENWAGVLHPDLFDADSDADARDLSQEAIRAFMREGRDPFRPGAQPLLRETEPPPDTQAEAALQMTPFVRQLRQLALAEDVEGLTKLIETWPQRDEEWEQALLGRLMMPSTTPEQRARLKALQQRHQR